MFTPDNPTKAPAFASFESGCAMSHLLRAQSNLSSKSISLIAGFSVFVSFGRTMITRKPSLETSPFLTAVHGA